MADPAGGNYRQLETVVLVDINTEREQLAMNVGTTPEQVRE
jgi:hypothetical protein